jgi:hypothetical protein
MGLLLPGWTTVPRKRSTAEEGASGCDRRTPSTGLEPLPPGITLANAACDHDAFGRFPFGRGGGEGSRSSLEGSPTRQCTSWLKRTCDGRSGFHEADPPLLFHSAMNEPFVRTDTDPWHSDQAHLPIRRSSVCLSRCSPRSFPLIMRS